MPLETASADRFSRVNSSFGVSPLRKLEQLAGFERYQPVDGGFRSGVASLATKTRGFFGRFGFGKKR